MAYEDNYSVLISDSIPSKDSHEWRFTMEEHKSKGTMKVGVRQFKNTESYTGPTKNGISIAIESLEQIEAFQKKFNEFIEECKKML